MIYPIEVVIGMADLIVVGEIESLNAGSYQFQVNQTLKGQADEGIRVERYKEWICDIRVKKPEIGQKLVLFLTQSGGKYEIINGSSGELFIENDSVFVPVFNQQPTLSELAEAVKSASSCFEMKHKKYPSQGGSQFIQLKPNDYLEEIAKQSAFSAWLIERFKRNIIEE